MVTVWFYYPDFPVFLKLFAVLVRFPETDNKKSWYAKKPSSSDMNFFKDLDAQSDFDKNIVTKKLVK